MSGEAKTNRDISADPLGEFSRILAHDLQQPLFTLRGYLELLDDNSTCVVDETAKEFIHRSRRSVDRLQSMLDELSSFAKSGTKPKQLKAVSLNEVVSVAQSQLYDQISSKQAEISVSDLPEVMGDRSLLTMLFAHLLRNSLLYVRDRSPVIRITSEKVGERVKVTVEDNGIGFPESESEKIFQPFYRLHRRDEYPGIGLGLAVCKRVLEILGGEIRAESVEGEGSKFFVLL